MPFLREIKKSDINYQILFHQTVDKRVLNFFIQNNFSAIECKDGEIFKLSKELEILTWNNHDGSDSFCLTKLNDISILNINDCRVDTHNKAKSIRKKILRHTENLDILFTQFGYANWIGIEEDQYLRQEAAEEKLCRIKIQHDVLKPSLVIPFASFVYFAKEENYYMNDKQNGVSQVRSSEILREIQQNIVFMQPNQSVLLDKKEMFHKLKACTDIAESFWQDKKKRVDQKEKLIYESQKKSPEEIKKVSRRYLRKINFQCFLAPFFFELLRIKGMKSLKIFITDLNISISLSYLSGFRRINNLQLSNYDLIINSGEIFFLLKNDFGWNTLEVSGAFKLNKSIDIKKLDYFFKWQTLFKDGFSFKNPKKVLLVAIRFLENSLFK